MKKLKKALSLTLTLALSLSLAVPAFAAGSEWNLSIQGKSDSEVTLPSAVYTLRRWDWGYHEDDEYDHITLVRSEKTEQVTLDRLIGLNQGDTMILTARTDDYVTFKAFSDPDGDGVYEQVIFEEKDYFGSFQIMSVPSGAEFLPYEYQYSFSDDLFLDADGKLYQSLLWMKSLSEEGTPGEWIDVTISAGYLFQELGANSLVSIEVEPNDTTQPGSAWYLSLTGDSQPSTPTTPTTPSTPAVKAVLSPQNLTVDGKDIDCEKYNIDGSNYFKLRDLAQLLSGTGSQFEVGYDEAASTVKITTGQAYTPAGGELATGADNSATAQPSTQSILIDGAAHSELTVYNIGGSNFFQLRELGNVLNFAVDYDVSTDTAIVRSAQK